MNEAEQAYEAAREEIARVKAAGADELRLSGEEFHSLDRLPPELANLTDLRVLNLDSTQVSDIGPLAGLTRLKMLNLNGTQVSDLASLQSLASLQALYLNFTQVSDLAPLSDLKNLTALQLKCANVSDVSPLTHLTKLRVLGLSETKVSDIRQLSSLINLEHLDINFTKLNDIEAIRSLSRLQSLGLNFTQVSDISALSGLKKLQSLGLIHTKVQDLRPISELNGLVDYVFKGLMYESSESTKYDSRLADLARIKDHQQRARETLRYLRSLPPWPEPYTPAATPDGSPPQPLGFEQQETRIPAPKAAPIEVAVIDGKLRTKPPATPLNDAPHVRARQAWAALQDSLHDLTDMRPRIDNQMPALDRVLRRLDTALGQEYDAANQIELGILGERVIAQAHASDETMADSDAAELKTFAAALAVFLERFPDWKAYRDDDTAPAPPEPLASSLFPEIDAVFDDLMDRDEIDQIIPSKLKEQTEDLRNEPENRRLLRGFVDSANNVLGALAEAALAGARWFVGEARDFGGVYWKDVKRIAAGGAAIYTVGKVTGLSKTATEFFRRNADSLRSMAQANPEEFGWLLKFLSLLGL